MGLMLGGEKTGEVRLSTEVDSCQRGVLRTNWSEARNVEADRAPERGGKKTGVCRAYWRMRTAGGRWKGDRTKAAIHGKQECKGPPEDETALKGVSA